MAQIIDGKALSLQKKQELKKTVDAMRQKGLTVCLAVILVGDDPASGVYVANKEKDCAELGIESRPYRLPADTKMEDLLTLVDQLNRDPSVNGILCQLPLPSGLNADRVIAAIDPRKDVDAFHPENVGHIMIGRYHFLPCTPAGVMKMLDHYGVEIRGKRCVVVGRSNIVGKPMAMLLLQRDGTVTVCHSKTKGLTEICREADILVCAIGRPRFITADMVKDGAVVIDVGMNRVNGHWCGDVDFEAVSGKASAITPVPGGVGPMTREVLMENTVMAAALQYDMGEPV